MIVSLLATLALVSIPQEKLEAKHYCTFTGEPFGEELFGFDSDKEAQAALARIMKTVGLEPNFVLMAGNVPNAAAVIEGGKRVVLYSQTFMAKVKAEVKDWGSLAILAHEIGHHLQGHTLEGGGSRPTSELQADKYSGHVLHLMGASLEQAQAAMKSLASDQATPTHPGKQARLAAIANGWTAAKDMRDTKPAVREPEQKPAPQQAVVNAEPLPPAGVPPAPKAPVYEFRAVFPADPQVYYVMSDNQIVVVLPNGQVSPVGRRIAPTWPGFVWMYATPYGTHGVDSAGRIWTRDLVGQNVQVGHLVKP